MVATSLKRLLFRALAFVLVVLFMVGLFEIYLRATIPPARRGSIVEYSLNTKRYKEMRRNARVEVWGVELRTNELGFRDDREEVPLKQEGRLRAVVLGDSFAVGGGVEFDKIFTTLLRERLPDVDVVNLAIGGLNPVWEKLVLEEVGLGLDPEMILVAVFPGDDFEMGENATREYYRRRALSGEGATAPRSGIEALYVYRGYGRRIVARLGGYFGASAESDVDETGWPDNLAALKEMSEMAERRGIWFAAFVMPNTGDFENQREAVARVLEYCSDQEIRCLDSLDHFIDSGVRPSSLRLNLIDSHPGERFHAMLADFLTPHLNEAAAAIRE